MRLVVDASVALKWFLTERSTELHVPQAKRISELVDKQGWQLLAPPHWTIEVLSVLCRLNPVLVPEAMRAFDELNPYVIQDAAVMRLACDLSQSLNHHLFDTLYHAVALEAGATLVTADDRYFDKAAGHGGVMRLADFPVTAQ